MIGTEALKYVDNTKYLGITFCETLKHDKKNDSANETFVCKKVINCYAFLVIVQLM